MARQRNRSRRNRTSTPRSQYARLEHRLTLLAWLNNLFGYKSNEALLKDCKDVAEDDVAEDYASDGHSHLYHLLIARGSKVRVPEEDLARYDENIREHLARINCQRPEPITLRYFQHLAALYTEIFLDRLFNHKAQLLADLNDFVNERNACKVPGEPQDEPFTENDLSKLAYWMATGSGKTLILHLNYYQFLHYNRELLDNILLITPNEGLSEQHLRELALSGIPARRFDLNQSGLFRTPNEVQVLEITKLVEQKRGGGVSVPVEAFEGRNLIFVDEGHKGTGGEAWRGYRDALGETGFTFEYSATFGQALSAAGDDELTKEYGKAILFDYSYRYFYNDGFGKDFRILNLRDDTDEDHTNVLLLGNLLSYYEQLRLYETHSNELRPYNLEKPLWVFVGSTVKAVYSKNNQKRSDVLTVARFLHKVLKDRSWVEQTIEKLLAGQSGLRTPSGLDVFLSRFKYLKELKLEPSRHYEYILEKIFHTVTGGGLHLVQIRGSQGEIGLKAAGADKYAGVIYIGDTSEFRNLATARAEEITWEEEVIRNSLFDSINRPDSPIHVLIGAKKFIEGWNSWRVSSMGLLNIGRSEGSQIIQLFGRGVRLKGKGISLKRSAVLPGPHPKHIDLLETLNIFAVRANYMAQFRAYLEREGVDADQRIQLSLFTKLNERALDTPLYVPRLKKNSTFAREELLQLQPDEKISVVVDLSVKVETMSSTAGGVVESQAKSATPKKLNELEEFLFPFLDWQEVYSDLLQWKALRGWDNLVFTPQLLRELIGQIKSRCELIAPTHMYELNSFIQRTKLQDAVLAMLKTYITKFYHKYQRKWESGHLEYQQLDKDDPNLVLHAEENGPAYHISIPQSKPDLIEAIKDLLENHKDKLYKEDEDETLPRLYFCRHLYFPLLLNHCPDVKISPPGLNESEARFVKDLRKFWKKEHDKSMLEKEVFVLRNLSRGKGIGFFENSGFYPDFIVWIVDKNDPKNQRLVFVEPHGMLFAKAYQHDPKARLHENLAELSKKLAREDLQISLDSYLISATTYKELKERYADGNWTKEDFASRHILFPEEDLSHITQILNPPRAGGAP